MGLPAPLIVDSCFYPLGSCTMKYNPKINEDVAALPGLTLTHPYQGENLSQGCLASCMNWRGTWPKSAAWS